MICTHEDRPLAMPGVKLLVLSLEKHCPGVPVTVSCAFCDDQMARWVKGHPDVVLRVNPSMRGRGWDVKPTLLLQLLDEGHEEVVWIDSDVIAAKDVRGLLVGRSPDELVVTESWYWDFCQGGTTRTRLWGLEPGRSLPRTISTGLVRVTAVHRPLLLAWQHLLADDGYRQAQRLQPVHARPVHMHGDQDVLTALVGSKPFGHIPLVYLKRGKDMVLYIGPAGYAIHERLANLGRGLPPFVHGAAPKLWETDPNPSLWGRPAGYVRQVALELSPYTWVARRYRDELGTDVPGLDVRTAVGRFCQMAAFGNPALQDLPQAIFLTVGKRVKRMLGLTRPSIPPGSKKVDTLLSDATIDMPTARSRAGVDETGRE